MDYSIKTRLGISKDFLKEFECVLEKKPIATILVAFSYWEQARFSECRKVITDGIG